MTRQMGIALLSAATFILPAAGLFSAAMAQAPATAAVSTIDVAEGDRLAHTLCVNCHIVDRRGPLLRTDRVPSFPWVAQQPGLTQDFLTGWLSSSVSHERMPDFSLTRDEIRQLSAYIVSLKKP